MDSLPCRLTIGVPAQQLIVLGVDMPDVRNHCQADRLPAELFGGGAAANNLPPYLVVAFIIRYK